LLESYIEIQQGIKKGRVLTRPFQAQPGKTWSVLKSGETFPGNTAAHIQFTGSGRCLRAWGPLVPRNYLVRPWETIFFSGDFFRGRDITRQFWSAYRL